MSRRLRVLLACECYGRVRDEFARRGWEAWSADILPSETPVTMEVRPTDVDRPFTPSPLDGSPLRGYPGAQTGHYQGDVKDVFDWAHPVNQYRMEPGKRISEQPPLWDLIIGFPPCTRLTFAGNRWRAEWRANGEEDAAADFFMAMISAPAAHVAVENPRGVMFSRYRKPDQTIQPWWFGDPFRKSTCLWLKGLPLLEPEFTEPEVLATVTSGDSAGYGLHRAATGGGSHRTDAGSRKPVHDFNGRKHYEDSEGRKNRARVRSRTFQGVARAMASQWGPYVEDAAVNAAGIAAEDVA